MDFKEYFSQAEGRAKRYNMEKGFGRPQKGAIQTIRLTNDASHLPDAEYAGGSGGEFDKYDSFVEDVEPRGYGSYHKVDVSRPYIVVVQNRNSFRTNYVLFGSSQNRTSATFGNPVGITVTYGLLGYTYTQLLADTEAKPFTLGRIRIDLLDDNPDNLTAPLAVSKISSEGTVFSSPLTPYTALNQFIQTAIEIPCNFELDGDTSINGSLLANSGIRLSFFPAHRVSPRQPTQAELAEIAYRRMRMFLLICDI